MWIILIYKTKTNINTNRLPPPSFYSYPYGRWVITVQNFSVCVCVCVCSTRERWKNGDGSFALYLLLLFLCVRCVCYLLSTPALVTILYWCSYTIQRRKKETSSHELVLNFILKFFCLHFLALFFFLLISRWPLQIPSSKHTQKKRERKKGTEIFHDYGWSLFFSPWSTQPIFSMLFFIVQQCF